MLCYVTTNTDFLHFVKACSVKALERVKTTIRQRYKSIYPHSKSRIGSEGNRFAHFSGK